MSGRWAGNVLHDGSDEVENEFAKFGERGNGWSRITMVLRIIRDRQYGGGVFGGGGYIGDTGPIVMKELRVGSSIRQRVQ